jgi:L-amino acid N-acyltransferase YncA
MERVIRPIRPGDEERICEIYNHYVRSSHVTFEEEPVGPAEVASRIAAVTGTLPYLVCEDGGAVIGYAYATPWRQRSAYRYTVEVSAYVDEAAHGRGIGRTLYETLLPELVRRGVHAALAGIAQPNAPSERLHERFGFAKVAHLNEVGWKLGRWIDVAYWELVFGRRARSEEDGS